MSLADEIYMKYHISQLRDLDDETVGIWKEGQDRWCMRTHGVTSEDYYAELDAHSDWKQRNQDFDGVGGYGSSGRQPLPEKYHGGNDEI